MVHRNLKDLEIHGHRGSRGTHPENCLPSFEEAFEAGADYFELDTQLSSDDVPVVFHDPCITGRLCRDSQGKVVEAFYPIRILTVAEIKQFDCGSVPQPKFPKQMPVPGTKISTLDEVLAWLVARSSRLGVNIEMKVEATHAELLPDLDLYTKKILDLIEGYGLIARTQFQSFDFAPLKIARARFRDLRISCLFENEADFAAEAYEVGANAVGPFFEHLTVERIQACHEKGLRVIPWTVNDPQDWERLIRMGVDGLITDYPRELARYLGR